MSNIENTNWQQEFDNLGITFTSDINRSICKQFIAKLLLSKDAELAAEIEKMKRVCKEDPVVCGDMGCMVGMYNDALDDVLKLINKAI